MKKIFLPIFLFCLLSIIFIPVLVNADGLCDDTIDNGIVPCGNTVACPCTIGHFFVMLARIYKFIVYQIATPLAIIAITIGGILMMISAGNPNLMSTGKKVLYSAIIGLVLVFCSYLIIKFILTAIGYQGSF